MKPTTMLYIAGSLCLMLPACSSSATPGDNPPENGTGGRDSGADADGGTEDVETDGEAEGGEDAATGPWTCVPPNTAVWKATGGEELCSYYRCREGTGCRRPYPGCRDDSDCLTSTLERGDPVDFPICCDLTNKCIPAHPALLDEFENACLRSLGN